MFTAATAVEQILILRGTVMEQHSLLLDSHQALVEPRPGHWLSLVPGLDTVLAPDGHLEAAVDDLTGCPEVVQD